MILCVFFFNFDRLTSFVLKSFSQARQFIFIDDKELIATIKWIESNQLETGCFRKYGNLFLKELKVTSAEVSNFLDENRDKKHPIDVVPFKFNVLASDKDIGFSRVAFQLLLP